MTLAVAVVTPQLAFVGADRRYSGAIALRDFKAVKICSIETTDAYGLITFAGVGARVGSAPFELSIWITQVLRGHKRTLDQSLHAIALTATEQRLHKKVEGHAFGFAGFTGRKMSLQTVTSMPELFSIPLSGIPTRLDIPASPAPFRVLNFNIPQNKKALGILLGSGTPYVNSRTLLDLSRQARRASTKEIGGERWAAMWGRINRMVAMREPTVGPETMCAWRFNGGGGKHVSYTADGSAEKDSGSLPSVGHSLPISDIVDRLFTHVTSTTDPMDAMSKMNQEITDEPHGGPFDETEHKILTAHVRRVALMAILATLGGFSPVIAIIG